MPAAPNPISKLPGKSSDKAPLLDQAPTNPSTTAKRKLVPERTVQISDVNTSRFKSTETTVAPGTKSNTNLSEIPSTKVPLTAADSGIYGADLTDEILTPPKTNNEPSKFLANSVTNIVVNPLNETPSPVKVNDEIDHTIQSAYPDLIDATTSENEGTLCGSAEQSRRTSTIKASGSSLDSNFIENNLQSVPHPVPFNPLHVILKKDANKYYTTEYI